MINAVAWQRGARLSQILQTLERLVLLADIAVSDCSLPASQQLSAGGWSFATTILR